MSVTVATVLAPSVYDLLHGPTMFAIKAKIYAVLYKQSSSIAFDETSSYWLALKDPNFSAFHRSPQGNLVSIGQHFVTTRVVHLPKRIETSLITEADLITEPDQAVRAVHSCNSWFYYLFKISFSNELQILSGRGSGVGRCNCAVVRRPTNFDNSRARAYCACSRCGLGWCRLFFLSSIISLFYLPASGRRPDIY